MMNENTATTPYSRQVGDRLRVIRRQKQLSLHEVECRSEQEFKASVLGAYERGERVMSLPRLDRLAQFYGVPIEQLLPHGSNAHEHERTNGAGGDARLAIDVASLATLDGESCAMLTRFLRSIQVQRQDFSADVITIRSEDAASVAAMLDVPINQVVARLAALGVLSAPAT